MSDVRNRVLTYDADKRWACTGICIDEARVCGYILVPSTEDPRCLTCQNHACERYSLLIDHPDLRSCETRPGAVKGKSEFNQPGYRSKKEDSHGGKRK